MMSEQSSNADRGRWILYLSILFAVLALLLAICLAWPSGSSGFLSNLGQWLAIIVLAWANLLCLLLNSIYLYLSRPQTTEIKRSAGRTLVILVVVLQLPVAAYTVYEYVDEKVQDYRYQQAYQQRQLIVKAIQRDSLDTFLVATQACNDICKKDFSAQSALVSAAQFRAYKVAGHLLKHGERAQAGLNVARVSLKACDAIHLSPMHALAVAVANNDVTMLTLLLPSSSAQARRQALWTAAQLDRLTLLQLMQQFGLSLEVHGDILDNNESLLVAAAEGAAVNTGRWLITERAMSIHALKGPDSYAGRSSFAALMGFALRNDVPRNADFLTLLIEQGQLVDELRRDGKSWLQEAIQRRNKSVAQLLLQFGADQSRLSSAELKELEELLGRKDAVFSFSSTAECIAVGD